MNYCIATLVFLIVDEVGDKVSGFRLGVRLIADEPAVEWNAYLCWDTIKFHLLHIERIEYILSIDF